MKVRQIIHNDNDDLNKDNEQYGLPKHNYKREANILFRLDERLRKKHELCDHLIMIIMKHRAKGVKLTDEIRKMTLIREYDKAEAMLEEVEHILQNLRENNLLKKIEKEITYYL